MPALIATRDSLGYCPIELNMGSIDEAKDACAATNLTISWSPEEADGVILGSMGGRTA